MQLALEIPATIKRAGHAQLLALASAEPLPGSTISKRAFVASALVFQMFARAPRRHISKR
jgi:hypothetical protein